MTYPNYLAAHRKHWALSKRELAHLIGFRSHHPVSRCEVSLREPTSQVLVGCEVVFGLSARKLFPAYFARVEEDVMGRALRLDEALRWSTEAVAERKRELLLSMVARSSEHPVL